MRVITPVCAITQAASENEAQTTCQIGITQITITKTKNKAFTVSNTFPPIDFFRLIIYLPSRQNRLVSVYFLLILLERTSSPKLIRELNKLTAVEYP